MYIIVRGSADVVKETNGHEEILARLNAGEMFGELALLNQPTRMASIRCVTALDVIVIRRSEFGVLASNLASFRENVDRLAAERMQSEVSQQAARSVSDAS